MCYTYRVSAAMMPPRPPDFYRSSIPTCRPPSLLFHSLYTLPSSVASNSFACHSYENCRGVGVFFPFWNWRSRPATDSHRPSNSHGIISFADPHPLNSAKSYRYKNIGGRTCTASAFGRSGLQTLRLVSEVSFFFSNTYALFCAILQFFAFIRNSTHLFSGDSALFVKKTRGKVQFD